MPERCFKCTVCGKINQQIQDLFDDIVPTCTCGGATNRSYKAESDNSRPTKMFHEPIEMFSVGMSPEEVPVFREANPAIEVRAGVPVAKTRQEKKRVLKYFGYGERN